MDVRLLRYRTDLIDRACSLGRTGGEVRATPITRRVCMVFSSRHGVGALWHLHELAEMGGAELSLSLSPLSLSLPDLIPQIQNEGGRWALNLLASCCRRGLVPPAITGWHYDKVHDCFRGGAAMVGDHGLLCRLLRR